MPGETKRVAREYSRLRDIQANKASQTSHHAVPQAACGLALEQHKDLHQAVRSCGVRPRGNKLLMETCAALAKNNKIMILDVVMLSDTSGFPHKSWQRVKNRIDNSSKQKHQEQKRKLTAAQEDHDIVEIVQGNVGGDVAVENGRVRHQHQPIG